MTQEAGVNHLASFETQGADLVDWDCVVPSQLLGDGVGATFKDAVKEFVDSLWNETQRLEAASNRIGAPARFTSPMIATANQRVRDPFNLAFGKRKRSMQEVCAYIGTIISSAGVTTGVSGLTATWAIIVFGVSLVVLALCGGYNFLRGN